MTAVRSRHSAPRARAVAPSARSGAARPRSSARSLPQESTGPRLTVVAVPRTGWRRVLAGAVALLLLVMAASLFVQGERISIQERSDLLATKIARADERGRELRVQVATAESPERILDQAAAMGMVEPGPAAAVPAADPSAPVGGSAPVPGESPGPGRTGVGPG